MHDTVRCQLCQTLLIDSVPHDTPKWMREKKLEIGGTALPPYRKYCERCDTWTYYDVEVQHGAQTACHS